MFNRPQTEKLKTKAPLDIPDPSKVSLLKDHLADRIQYDERMFDQFQQQQQQKNSLPEWPTFPLRDRPADQIQCGEIFMDHYLVLLLQDPDGKEDFFGDYSNYCPKHYGRVFSSSQKPEYRELPTSLLAFDLQDKSIQEVKLDESLFPGMQDCTYTKYKDNQIIKFGGHTNKMVRITIESFEPLSVKCEEIKVEGEQPPNLYGHTAHMYNDYLYVYGGINERTDIVKNDLWSFDPDVPSWKLCQSFGEKSIAIWEHRSFIIQNKLYAFKGDSENTNFDIVNLDSMMWTRLQQEKTFLRKQFGCAVFGNNLLVLKEDFSIVKRPSCDLCCWNINTNSWSTMKIKAPKVIQRVRNLTVYKNLLVVTGFTGWKENQVPIVALLDLTSLGLSIPEEPEKKVLKSLFMSEEESDIKFKVQDQIIPAHKHVLITKSKYFAGLFNSGMTESRQSIIEIPDCDPPVFQEFLRFLYEDEMKLNEDLAIQLFPFADKYVQSDLSEKCVNFLKHKINCFNVFKILDFARQQNISLLKTWCLDLLNRINADTIFWLVDYLNKPNDPEFAQENLELRDLALPVILNNFHEISKNPRVSPTFYEDFLIKNIGFDTIVHIGKFIYGHNFKTESSQKTSEKIEQSLSERIKAIKKIVSDRRTSPLDQLEDMIKETEEYIERDQKWGKDKTPEMIEKMEKLIEDDKIKTKKLKSMTANLRAALAEFFQANFQTLFERNIVKELPSDLLADLIFQFFGNQTISQTSNK